MFLHQVLARLLQRGGLTRRSLVHDLIAAGELVQLSEIVTDYANPYWLVWPLRSHGSAKLNLFADWLVDEVRLYRAALVG